MSGPGASEPPVAEDVLPLDEVGLHPLADGAAGEAYAGGPAAEGLAGDGAEGPAAGDDHYEEDDAYEEAEDEEYEDGEGEEEDEEAEAGGSPVFEAPEAMCRMLFVDVVLVLPSTSPVVVLQEADPPYRELRIPVGGPEGVAIGYAARQMQTPRPLTHELMSRLLEAFSLSLDVVRITESTGRTFRAEIVVSGPSGARTIDCRPSDAIALSLRQRVPVPIVAAPAVLEAAGAEAAGSN